MMKRFSQNPFINGQCTCSKPVYKRTVRFLKRILHKRRIRPYNEPLPYSDSPVPMLTELVRMLTDLSLYQRTSSVIERTSSVFQRTSTVNKRFFRMTTNSFRLPTCLSFCILQSTFIFRMTTDSFLLPTCPFHTTGMFPFTSNIVPKKMICI